MAKIRWRLSQPDPSSIPLPVMVVLVSWLAALFVSFGLFSPRNATVVVTLLVCALAVSGAMYLIVDLDQPFSGTIRVSKVPFELVLSEISR